MSDYPKWQPLAERTRQALHLLGFDVPKCLPGEPAACGWDFAHHAPANLAALKAVVEDRVAHLGDGSQPLVEEVYASTLATLRAEPPCEQGHQLGHRARGPRAERAVRQPAAEPAGPGAVAVTAVPGGLPHAPLSRAFPCGGSEPTPDLQAMTDDELIEMLEAVILQDPWILDWEAGHMGRRIREEQEHRRLLREPSP